MKKSLLVWLGKLCLFLLFSTVLKAQTTPPGVISGLLLDSTTTKPIEYATVALLPKGQTQSTAGTLTDGQGRFTFTGVALGEYELVVSFLGYETKTIRGIALTEQRPRANVGPIQLPVVATNLKEVNVQAMRPTITQEADRMVVSVEGTAMAAGNTAFTVLARSPGVFVDAEGNIQLNGRSGVTVMIDGRLTYLSARDLRAMLEGMSAENIKNIEIITNPSAKYDAEGTSGILNINLKKNTQRGINGSVYAGYTNNFQQYGYTYGGNINHKSGRWNSFLNLDAARRVGGREATFTRIFYGQDRTTYFDQVATGNFTAEGPPSVRLGTDYSLNDRHSVGFTSYYVTNRAVSDFLTDTYIGYAPATPSQYIDADNISSNTFTSFTSNLHYTGKLDTLGTTLSTDLDYARIGNRGEANFYNYFTDLATGQQTRDFLYTNTPNGYNIYSAKVDFTRPLAPGHKMEAGIKGSRVVSDNDFRFYFNNERLVLDPQRTNHFNYRESILAAYVNWNGKLSKRFTLQAGLRAENTSSLGTSYTTGQVTERDYLNFFPSLFLQQKVREDYQVSYSYSRRLTRPNYGNLNPFRSYRDPYTYTEGNPYLRPQYTQSFGINQTFKKVYNLNAFYNYNRDVMAEIPILDVANATTIYTTGNVNDGYNIGFTGVAPLKIAKWWDTQNTTVLSYSKFTMVSNEGPLVNDQVFFMLQSNHTIQLPLEVRMELNLLYRGPAASGLYHMAPMHRVDVAFKRSFKKKKLDLTVNANDLFKGFRYYWTTDIGGNVNEFDQYFRWRSVGATLRYNFSKGQKVDVKRRNNSLEEMNRT
ncbi:outer membrane beta-barrel family protein [Telluribacter sp. SYSU D00476]|uniref:outer membrane beta-barrel family protein n=1 Tax=Telluribacter sp. SYSU D00476 TaxID=2811430 RepID=UPI001FF657F4|nr:outer membrane beta-barrel family protein [Telluribacter sp. SYSU D00476]